MDMVFETLRRSGLPSPADRHHRAFEIGGTLYGFCPRYQFFVGLYMKDNLMQTAWF